MKHKPFLLLCFMFAALVSANIAHAHEDMNVRDEKPLGGHMEERRDMMNDARDQKGMMDDHAMERKDIMRENAGQLRDTMKMRFDDSKKERLGGMMGMMKRRFAWAIDRLDNIADRIETRIEKIEDETGTKLDDARMHLDETRADIDDATELLAEIDTDVDYITADETKIGERFSGFHDAFGKVKEEIKSAWMHLRESLQAIKGAHGDDEKHADAE